MEYLYKVYLSTVHVHVHYRLHLRLEAVLLPVAVLDTPLKGTIILIIRFLSGSYLLIKPGLDGAWLVE